jgi:hypothetical protein
VFGCKTPVCRNLAVCVCSYDDEALLESAGFHGAADADADGEEGGRGSSFVLIKGNVKNADRIPSGGGGGGGSSRHGSSSGSGSSGRHHPRSAAGGSRVGGSSGAGGWGPSAPSAGGGASLGAAAQQQMAALLAAAGGGMDPGVLAASLSLMQQQQQQQQPAMPLAAPPALTSGPGAPPSSLDPATLALLASSMGIDLSTADHMQAAAVMGLLGGPGGVGVAANPAMAMGGMGMMRESCVPGRGAGGADAPQCSGV